MPLPSNRQNAIRVTRGQTKIFLAKVKRSDGGVARLGTAVVARMTARKSAGSVPVIEKTTSDGIEIVDPTTGDLRITLTSSDTQTLRTGSYKYDLWLEFPGNPPLRFPIVVAADLEVSDGMTDFS